MGIARRGSSRIAESPGAPTPAQDEVRLRKRYRVETVESGALRSGEKVPGPDATEPGTGQIDLRSTVSAQLRLLLRPSISSFGTAGPKVGPIAPGLRLRRESIGAQGLGLIR